MTEDIGLTHRNLVDIASDIAEGFVSSEEVTKACLDRIVAVQLKFNCFISIEADAALLAARKADAARSRGDNLGLLHGVPLAHKDMFYRAGIPSTGDSAIRRDFVPDCTAMVMQRLVTAGPLCLDGLNMSEVAVGPVGHNEHCGHCRNPWNLAHAPGGSSSGSGASGEGRSIWFMALLVQTQGAVRIPAALCGLVGMKGIQGRVSRYGGMPLSYSLDCFGLLARTVVDCARFYRVIAGPGPMDPTSANEPCRTARLPVASR